MKPNVEYRFGPFRLDVANARLSRDRQNIPLKPKVFDVLAYLVQRAGQLVPQDELIHSIWPDTVVGDSSLKSCVRQIRQALDDDVRSPKYIETLHRRGYCFIAAVTDWQNINEAQHSAPFSVPVRPATLVGRDGELQSLHELLAQARVGRRQIVFVTGDAGSGKTALAEAILQQIVGDQTLLVATGQCFELYGASEAYQPFLEAISRLGRGAERERLVRVLSSHAPTWLARLPGLSVHNGATPQAAASPERMLREMAEALERLTVDVPMMLVVEDLHWADYSSLDLLSTLARRRDPARLMVLATYRPADVVASGHPLREVSRDLRARGLCHELPLKPLSKSAVEEYLRVRCPGRGLPEGLPEMLHRRTDGQPLFVVGLVDDWLEQGILVRGDDEIWELTTSLSALAVRVPANVRALIEKQIGRLSAEEFETLEGAAIAGVEFATAAAAAAIDANPARVDEICEAFARRLHFLSPCGGKQWPDGTVSARYRFNHELFYRVVSEGISPTRRRRLHQQLAERLEAAFGDEATTIAAELSLHFEQGTDSIKAVHYLEKAAHRAARQHSHREAIDYVRRALAQLDRLPANQRGSTELRLQLQLGVQLQITRGFADPQARKAFAKARDLSDELGESPSRFPAYWGLWLHHKARSELVKAGKMARELFDLAKELRDSALELQSHQALAVTSLCAGQPASTRQHMELGVALYEPQRHNALAFTFGQDPGVACRSFGAVALWLLGYPDQAMRTCREALRLSHELLQPSSQALALHFAAMLHQCRRDGEAALNCAELSLTIAAERGQSFWMAGATVMRGWAMAHLGNAIEGIAQMRQGLESWRSTGSLTYCTYYLALLAEAIGRNGDASEALDQIDQALELVEQTSERLFEAELYRLRGELLLAQSKRTEAIEDLHTAASVAEQQNAKSLELRALTSLARVKQAARARREIESRLADTVAWFTEGLDTIEWRAAKQNLAKPVPV